MIKGLGLALALGFALSLPAAAEEVTGTVKAIDRADHSFVLEDGTRLSVSDSRLADLTPGDNVQVVYEMRANTKVVTDLNRLTRGTEWWGTRSFNSMTGDMIGSPQAE